MIKSCAGILVSLGFTLLAAESPKPVFHASFDRGVDADLAPGDPKLYSAPKMEVPPKTTARGLPSNGVVTHEKQGGVTGGYLKFQKKAPDFVFFMAQENMPYHKTNWSGTVSFWLRLTPDEDLEPGFTDPIQITSKAWNNAAFFVEFSKDETPREFRLGVYADFDVWNPDNRDWNSIPMADKPLAPVIRPPFSRDQWTHVAFTFQNFNSGRPDGTAKLYLNGEERAALKPRTQTFTWDYEKALIMLGLSYVGGFDELAIFDRALSHKEIRAIGTVPAN
jgi:hypothetical protein